LIDNKGKKNVAKKTIYVKCKKNEKIHREGKGKDINRECISQIIIRPMAIWACTKSSCEECVKNNIQT
jgi:hypothetical protein